MQRPASSSIRSSTKNLPAELSEELSREMLGVRRRRAAADEDEGLFTEANLESMIRSNIVKHEVDRRLPPVPNTEWLAHGRVATLLIQKGAKILNVGNAGYPDLLFEVNGQVFAAEVKGEGDRLKDRQERVLDALKRLKRVFVVRESGTKVHPDELTLDEFLSEVLGSHTPR
jgi:hypothetical protein